MADLLQEKEATTATQTNTAILGQKEYMIILPGADYTRVATESVRGCYAVILHHPSRSCLIHWDDNTKKTELDRIVSEFLTTPATLDPKTCRASLVGGWSNNPDSNNHGDFLKSRLTQIGFTLDLQYFKIKKQPARPATKDVELQKTGFSYVLLDATTGEITIADTGWQTQPILGFDCLHATSLHGDNGADVLPRYKTLRFLDNVHCQDDKHPSSGSPLYSRDEYATLSVVQARQLATAAQKNQPAVLTQLLDTIIVDVNIPAPEAKGWTALHFACFTGSFTCAEILIQHSADITLKNEKGKTPLQLIKTDSEAREKLMLLWQIEQANLKKEPGATLRSFALFARHKEQLEPETQEQLAGIKSLLETPAGRARIRMSLATS